MGILDDAIREHLDLKRQHGARDTELREMEDDALGAGDRPDPFAPGELFNEVASPAPPAAGEEVEGVPGPGAMPQEPGGMPPGMGQAPPMEDPTRVAEPDQDFFLPDEPP